MRRAKKCLSPLHVSAAWTQFCGGHGGHVPQIFQTVGTWASERFFPGGALGDFFKIFLGGAKSGEICFFQSKLRKQPFLLKFSIS